jgi:cyclopropane fatty-acyl-phospholipid synthase-like methyltransferase
MSELLFSQASENNKQPILEVLRVVLAQHNRVLEIGSGTGQHAVYFAEQLPYLCWIPSDRIDNLNAIQRRLDAFPTINIAPLVELDVCQTTWPSDFDAVFSANTAHIMPWETTRLMLMQVAERLPGGGTFALYGPFNYQGDFPSESNARFNEWLKGVANHQGIRDFEKVNDIVCSAGLHLLQDYAMPTNNRMLVWRKS